MVSINGNLPIFIIVYQVIKYGTVSCSVQRLHSIRCKYTAALVVQLC
jgi:hypothetical protein